VSLTTRPSGRWPSILLVGPTGAGKTPLGRELEARGLRGRRCVHFDFGANLRAAASGQKAGPDLTPGELAVIRASLATGALFEAGDLPLIIKILSWFTESRRMTSGSLLILNGLPRHRAQAEALDATISVERVISLEADAAVIRERMRQDPGRDRAGRGDDTIEAVTRRLAIFGQRTASLVDHYRERGVPVTTIPVTATMTAAEMYGQVERSVQEERSEEFG